MALLSYLLQVILASGILYAYYHFVLRNNRFHQYNRYFLLLVPVISILVPFLDIPVYFSSASTDPASGLAGDRDHTDLPAHAHSPSRGRPGRVFIPTEFS